MAARARNSRRVALQDATGPVQLPVEYSRAVPTDGIWAANMADLGVQPAAVPGDVKLQLSTYREYLPADFRFGDLPEIGL